jgi:hypothetical protein
MWCRRIFEVDRPNIIMGVQRITPVIGSCRARRGPDGHVKVVCKSHVTILHRVEA